MCGIVGILNLEQKSPVIGETIQHMLGQIRHRGPDEFGIYLYQEGQHSVGLGNARLQIIDLSGGQQPISNEDGTLWIVFNGEIFNYLELRQMLVSEGHQFQTNSDTEVILHLWESFGEAGLQQLNGQFAFAIWNEKERSLLLVRDRVGIRPLYLTWQDGRLLFASEMKALLASGMVPAALDPLAVHQIFTTWSPVSPRTPLQGVQTLPPGHFMRVSPAGNWQIKPYWQLEFPEDSPQGRPLTGNSFSDLAGQCRDLLLEATRLRLRADVPVGAYLSGGLDSSIITALIHRYTNNKLRTFSIAFTDAQFDETPFQESVAAHLGTDHSLISCSHRDIGEAFPEVIWHTEAPLLRTAPVPLFLLSRLVRENQFKVVLTGEGADEFFGGYTIFREALVRRFWAKNPQSAFRPALLQKLYGYVENLQPQNLHKFFQYRLTDIDAADYSHAIRWRNTSRSKRLFSPEFAALSDGWSTDQIPLPDAFPSWSPLARAQYLEITLFMSEYLLSAQGDRVAMANSVEGRYPFLDHHVIAFANQLPPQFKVRGLQEKFILRQAVQDLLPPNIWQRPKRPYRAPIHHSFFPDGQPLPWVAELLAAQNLSQSAVFQPTAGETLRKKLERFGYLSETDDMSLAGLLSTQLFIHHFIHHFHPRPPLNGQDQVKWVQKQGTPT